MTAENHVELSSVLSHIPLFKNMEKNNREKLMSICVTSKIEKNHRLIKEGETNTHTYILLQGSVEVRKRSQLGDEIALKIEESNIEKHYYPLFGETSLVEDETGHTTSTIITNTICDMAIIYNKDFYKLIEEELAIGVYMYRTIAKILRDRLTQSSTDLLTLFDSYINDILEKE